jgi:predicted HTH domain antitoxin
MADKTIEIKIPETFPMEAHDLSIFLAAKLYESGRLSMGHAAQVAGLTKRAFMEIIGRYGVSIFNYSPDELEEDVRNA